MSERRTLLLVGATGLVGGKLLAMALADTRISRVVALARRPLPPHPRLDAHVVDFDALPADAAWWRADAVLCALGTTIRTAGSQDAFRRVDHAYPLAVARHAHAAGTPAYVLNSAMGANAASRVFYNKVKGELERDLQAVGFASLTLVRPGLIGGDRQEVRVGERIAGVVLRVLGPVLPRRFRVNPATTIARAMLDAALVATPGVRVIGSEQLA